MNFLSGSVYYSGLLLGFLSVVLVLYYSLGLVYFINFNLKFF